jgi:carboxypeptidase Q
MRKVSLFLSLLFLALAAVGTSPLLSQEATPTVRIIGSALAPSPLENNLQRLTDEIGGRVSGTPAMRRATAWAVEGFRAAGVDDVHTEPFTLPTGWSEGETQLEVTAPVEFSTRVVSLGWSPPTPADGLEAPVVYVGEGGEADFARAGERVRGALVLVANPVSRTWEDLFDEYLREPGIIERASSGGAVAILWMSSREHDLLYRHITGLDGTPGTLPEAQVAREDAERIARLTETGRTVRARLTMPNRLIGPVEEENVVAEIRGREKPDEIVLLGAHLDSWELGTGALDDGCNAALVIDAARALRAAGLRPRRTVRFVLFSGEEQGMLGSRAYVEAHRAEMDRTVAAVFYDSGIGRVTGYSLGGRKDIEAAVQELLAPVADFGSNQHTTDAFVGTDNFDFLLEGVPTLVANQEAANYMVNYHASSDTFDKVDIRELKLHTAYAAATIWGLAERPERVGPRQSRAEIEELLRETGLDQQMKVFGLWEAWESGERGRRP